MNNSRGLTLIEWFDRINLIRRVDFVEEVNFIKGVYFIKRVCMIYDATPPLCFLRGLNLVRDTPL